MEVEEGRRNVAGRLTAIIFLKTSKYLEGETKGPSRFRDYFQKEMVIYTFCI